MRTTSLVAVYLEYLQSKIIGPSIASLPKNPNELVNFQIFFGIENSHDKSTLNFCACLILTKQTRYARANHFYYLIVGLLQHKK